MDVWQDSVELSCVLGPDLSVVGYGFITLHRLVSQASRNYHCTMCCTACRRLGAATGSLLCQETGRAIS